MFIPIGTDRPQRRRPIVNELLIAINLLVYIIGLAGTMAGWFDQRAISDLFHYNPNDFQAWQLITYQFAHDPYGIGHVLFNMLFLWVFGNAVNDRLGNLSYLGFYLVGGCVAGLAHGMAEQASVIGASGSIAAVSGAFLALFPRARIKVLIFFFIIGVISIPAMWFIAFYFALDAINVFMTAVGGSDAGVAYTAHLSGYVYGFFVCFTLLALKILKREEYDIFFLFKQAQRRRALRSVTRQSPGVWENPGSGGAEDLAKSRKEPRPEMTEIEERFAADRSEISRLGTAHDVPGATAKYLALLKSSPELVMHERLQAEIANHLYQAGKHADAARAYEALLGSYPRTNNAAQYRLILGLIYARHLKKRDRARELIEAATPRLSAESERRLAEALLGELAT